VIPVSGHQIPGSDPAPAVDHQAAVAALKRRFPRVPIWFGEHTGHYFADVGLDWFLETETADQLGRQLETGWMPPRRP